MSSDQQRYFKAIAVGGKVASPAGIGIPIGYATSAPDLLGPLDGSEIDFPRTRLSLAEERGEVTLLANTVDANNGYLVGWTSPALLGASRSINRIWEEGSRRATLTSFDGDDVHQVLVGPAEPLKNTFRQIEEKAVVDYIQACIEEADAPLRILERFEPALKASLCTVDRLSRRRWNIVRHLGHAYWANKMQLKLEMLFELYVQPCGNQSFDQFFQALIHLQRSVEEHVRAHRQREKLEEQYHRNSPPFRSFASERELRLVDSG